MNAVAFLGWPVLMLSVQIGVALLRLDCVGKGRLFSRPLWRFRLFAPRVSLWTGYIFGTWTRLKQILVSCFIYTPLTIWSHSIWITVGYTLLVMALYLDDYFTGDDERWKRFKSKARNALRWLMELPRPVAE